MRIITPNPLNEYSCQSCQMLIKSTSEDLEIKEGIYPLCSSKCEFNVIMKKLKEYDNQSLVVMFVTAFPDDVMPRKRSELIYYLTKWYELSFSSTKRLL